MFLDNAAIFKCYKLQITANDGAENKIDAFYSRLSRPVMTDVEVAWEGIQAEEVYPSRLPDLYADEPLVVSMKLRSGVLYNSSSSPDSLPR